MHWFVQGCGDVEVMVMVFDTKLDVTQLMGRGLGNLLESPCDFEISDDIVLSDSPKGSSSTGPTPFPTTLPQAVNCCCPPSFFCLFRQTIRPLFPLLLICVPQQVFLAPYIRPLGPIQQATAQL